MDPMLVLLEKFKQTPNQSQLARDLGISRQHLIAMLKGHSKPGPKVMKALGIEKLVFYRQIPESLP